MPSNAEARLVFRLLASEDERRICAGAIDWRDLEGSSIAGIVRAILDIDERGERVDYATVGAALEDDADRDLLTRIAFRDEPEEGPGVEDCLAAFTRRRLTREGRQVLRDLGRLQEEADSGAGPATVDEQLRRIEQLARQRDRMM